MQHQARPPRKTLLSTSSTTRPDTRSRRRARWLARQVPAASITFLGSPFDSAILGVSFVPDPTGAANPFVWVAGGAGIASDTYETVILRHYVYSSGWNQVASPNPGPSNFLQGVSAFSPTSAWAVGQPHRGNNFVIERWSPSSPPWT
jgi:hypothetical protein